MTFEIRRTTLASLSRCMVLAAGLAGLGLVAGCSPSSGESGETTDDASVDVPVDRARPTSPSVEAPAQAEAPVESSSPSQAANCIAKGTCADPMCTEPGRYRVEGEVVVDLKNDQRLWQRNFATGLNYAEATTFCAGLKLRGISGWRLPNGAESGSIVLRAGGLKGCGVPGYCTPAIDQQAFPDTAVDLYWISQPYDDGMHLTRNYCDGRSTPYQEEDESPHYVRCVHDPI